ncbi:hypothetical protein H2200_006074 [Cladophialophora chaetospira]|uniref:Uncharacterized protein n=1 Tax=Cladophialophora chaetospira TaxID=386627 RepID=A0AA38XAE0_9EURO|nr:hypothetical protein H2200_006074 [Cladophialophora chaetospira]
MHSSSISLPSLALAVFLLQAVSADTTLPAISEYYDGQPQAGSYPTDPSSSWWASTTTDSLWQSTSSYENPFTVYTSQTNSLGVITGMPAVVTSQPTQPAVVTSQPASPTLPTYSGYWYNTTASSPSATLGNTILATSGTSFVTTTTSSSNPVATFAQVTGAASANKIASTGLGLVVAALAFCML